MTLTGKQKRRNARTVLEAATRRGIGWRVWGEDLSCQSFRHYHRSYHAWMFICNETGRGTARTILRGILAPRFVEELAAEVAGLQEELDHYENMAVKLLAANERIIALNKECQQLLDVHSNCQSPPAHELRVVATKELAQELSRHETMGLGGQPSAGIDEIHAELALRERVDAESLQQDQCRCDDMPAEKTCAYCITGAGYGDCQHPLDPTKTNKHNGK